MRSTRSTGGAAWSWRRASLAARRVDVEVASARRTRGRVTLVGIVALNVALTVYGLGWGLPDRWCLDEQVASSLRLLQSRSVLTVVSVIHPQLYNFFLAVLFVPYLV